MRARPRRLIHFRVDAGAKSGYGHLSRCLALAEAARQAGRRPVFFLGGGLPEAARRVRAAGFRAETIARSHPHRADLDRMRASRGGWLVVDGYNFDASYRRALRAAGWRLVVVDDIADMGPYEAELLINPNPGSEHFPYENAPGALVLQGARYALLSERFRRAHRISARARRVLVSMGAADLDNLSAKALQALRESKIERLRVELLIGAANAHGDSLWALAKEMDFPIELARDATDLPARMARADLMFSAGGVSVREAMLAGLPVVTGWCAANQKPGAEAMASAGAVLNVGDLRRATTGALASALRRLSADWRRRAALSRAGADLIDGRGARRVLAALGALDGESASEWSLRAAGPEDLLPVWRLANEPSVRAHSFKKGRIPIETHRLWFQKALSARDQALYVLEGAGILAGVARYSRTVPGEAEVHFSVHPAFRGLGVATAALLASWEMAVKKLALGRVIGRVILPNPASQRVFLKAGYRRLPSAEKGVALFERTKGQR